MTDLPDQPLSPLDGRYRPATAALADYLSEAGLNRARVEVEVEWLIALTDRSLFGASPLDEPQKTSLRALYRDFGPAEIDWLAAKEAVMKTELRQLRTWADIFDSSEMDVKKMIASYIIKRVTVYRDYKIEMELNISVRQYLDGIESIASEVAAS